MNVSGVSWVDQPPVVYLSPQAINPLSASKEPIALALAVLLKRERYTWAKAAGGVVALLGVAFALGDRVAVPGADTLRGDLLMFGAAVTGSIYNVTSGLYLRKVPGGGP